MKEDKIFKHLMKIEDRLDKFEELRKSDNNKVLDKLDKNITILQKLD